ncbi:MAG TPA: prenyltransferase [Thermoanaerobaculia bacterium]|nr:prenyltransferase [Thermoanaerobaculia bacterium]
MASFHFPQTYVHGHPHAVLSGLWRLADPKITVASAIPFLVAVALAIDARGAVDVRLAFAAFLAIFFVEAGKNAVNDLADYRSGADLAVRDDERSPFSGGKRVLVDHLLSERELTVIAWAAFTAAGIIGFVVAMHSRFELLLLGAVAAAIAVAYSVPPFQLSYRGLGELAVGVVYGPGIVIGGVLLLGGRITGEILVASLTLGLLIADVLLVNEIPDERADRITGKNTLVVLLGREKAVALSDTIFVGAFSLPLLAALYMAMPFRVVALAAGMPLAVIASDLLSHPRRPGPPVAAQALMIAVYVTSGLGYAAAVMLL